MSDSEWLAEMSMRALAENRIELALAVLRLTLQVRRIERENLQALSVPVVPGLAPTPRAAEVPAKSADDGPATEVIPGARCIVLGASGSECQGAIYWTDAGWRHLDPRHDNHHRPQADRAVSL